MSDVPWAPGKRALELKQVAVRREERDFWQLVSDGYYSFGEHGEIYRHATFHNCKKEAGPAWLKEPVEVRRQAGPGSYLRVVLPRRSGVVLAHRMAWQWYSGREIPKDLVINHKDGNPQNNTRENLEVVTHAENIRHAFRVLGAVAPPSNGEKNGSSKLTEGDVLEMRRLRVGGASYRDLAVLFGVHVGHVKGVCRGRTWKHLLDSNGPTLAPWGKE